MCWPVCWPATTLTRPRHGWPGIGRSARPRTVTDARGSRHHRVLYGQFRGLVAVGGAFAPCLAFVVVSSLERAAGHHHCGEAFRVRPTGHDHHPGRRGAIPPRDGEEPFPCVSAFSTPTTCPPRTSQTVR